MRRRSQLSLCRCGHPFLAHEHLRRGTDCAWCVWGGCDNFRLDRRTSAWRLRKLRRDSPNHFGSETF